ncbi:MAG: septal ring lytic transglycosylase RlpA family protein [Erythrobacter sp.]
MPQHRARFAQRLTLAVCLFVMPLGASSAQTTNLSAQFRTAPEAGPATEETDAFAQQFADVITPLDPDLVDIDLALPDNAVDLTTFEAPREVKPQVSVLRDLGTGVASYYGRRFHGRLTANGERFDMNAMTAAHKTLPFGTHVLVTNPRNGRSVTVRINDRGPFIRGRTIDLSRSAAQKLGIISSGHARVKLDIVSR